ncbi:methyltransferase [Nocardiopsis gilva YIM 90087]|uniref:Methyltransferase n=1 Tax=Nocardiopsis gilva YIM 90087 TaxID=1235441 RepID=A0A223SDV3_9ACTN|nr:methyltransferase [Nocardiopsis gilva YIM 90087]
MEMHEQLIHARALQIAAELRIGDLLADGPRTAADLATATDTHTDALYRMLRMLAARGVFTETDPGCFALTDLGAPLRSDHPYSVHATLAFGGATAQVFLDSLHSVRTGEATFPTTFGTSFFDYLAGHPEHGDLFNAAMREMSRPMLRAVLDAYDFSYARRIVDVGGGNGSLLSAILRSTPDSRGVVFDAPHVAEAAQEKLRAEGLADRCSVVGGDFFHTAPEDGDLYLLKWILHDWPDDQAATILRGCRNAMAPDGRVLIIEQVIPPGDTPHPGKTMDFSMLTLVNGRERTEEQFATLLADADLRLHRIVPTASPLSLIEAVSA